MNFRTVNNLPVDGGIVVAVRCNWNLPRLPGVVIAGPTAPMPPNAAGSAYDRYMMMTGPVFSTTGPSLCAVIEGE